MSSWYKIFFIGLIIAGIFIPAVRAQAHSPYVVHYPLGEVSADLYNLHNPQNTLTAQQKQWIAEGSAEEDTPFTRPVHHFYDPINNEGLQGFESSKKWAHDGGLQALNRFQFGGEYGVYTWEEAIAAYNRGDYRHAYKALGHILHLIQDASVPAHTRQDPHLHIKGGPLDIEMYGGADPFEKQAKSRSLKVSNLQELKPTNYKNLDNYFDAMALYSNRYFLSKDSLGYYDLPKITRMDTQYIYGRDADGSEIKLAKIPQKLFSRSLDVGIELDRSSFSDPEVINDYWSRLAPRSVEHSAGIIKLFHDTVVKQEPKEQDVSFWNKAIDGIVNRSKSTAELMQFVWNQYGPDIATLKFDPKLTLQPSPSPPYVIPAVKLNPSVSTYQEVAEKKAVATFAKQLQSSADELERQFQEFIDEQQAQIAKEQEQETVAELPLVPYVPPSQEIAQNADEQQDGLGGNPEGDQIIENNQPKLVLVTKVIDGDTIELADGKRVRLIGINAPEVPNDCYAQEATDYLSALVLNKLVALEKGPNDKDKYDRLLRYIWVDDTHINARLVETGHTYAYDFGFTHSYGDEFAKLQQTAKQNQLGLWGPACQKEDNQAASSGSSSDANYGASHDETEIAENKQAQEETKNDTSTDETATSTDETSTDETSTSTDETATSTDETSTSTDETATSTDETSTSTDETATTTDETSTTTDDAATTTDEITTSTEPTMDVVINEVAWMGTTGNKNYLCEWIELRNTTENAINLSDWKLYEQGGDTLIITLTQTISPNGYYLIERVTPSCPDAVPSVSADDSGTFGGSGLKNLPSGEHLVLKDVNGNTIDEINAAGGWPAGDNDTKETMSLVDGSWVNGPVDGTPRAQNYSEPEPEPEEPESEPEPEFEEREEPTDGIVIFNETFDYENGPLVENSDWAKIFYCGEKGLEVVDGRASIAGRGFGLNCYVARPLSHPVFNGSAEIEWSYKRSDSIFSYASRMPILRLQPEPHVTTPDTSFPAIIFSGSHPNMVSGSMNRFGLSTNNIYFIYHDNIKNPHSELLFEGAKPDTKFRARLDWKTGDNDECFVKASLPDLDVKTDFVKVRSDRCWTAGGDGELGIQSATIGAGYSSGNLRTRFQGYTIDNYIIRDNDLED